MKVKLVLEAKPKNVGLAREWAFENCRNFGIKSRRLVDVKTITSEMVTNVVRHAYRYTRSRNFILTVKLYANKLTISVKDYGNGFNKSRSHSLHVGLQIVRSLADDVKIRSFWLGTRVKTRIYLKEVEVSKALTLRHLILAK